MHDNRNTILAIVLSAIILTAWQYFFAIPRIDHQRQKMETEQAINSGNVSSVINALKPRQQTETSPPPIDRMLRPTVDRSQKIAMEERVIIDTPSIGGSLNLKGGYIDDIFLKKYHETVSRDSPSIILLSPEGTPNAYYARFGWINNNPDQIIKLPNEETLWQVERGGPLAPDQPVTLIHDNGEGLLFRRIYSIDENYMITMQDSLINKGNSVISVHPYSSIYRHDTPKTQGFYILHEGIIGLMGEEQGLQTISYSDLQERLLIETSAQKGWLGITDKYWATVLIPDQDANYQSSIVAFPNGPDFIYQLSFLHDAHTLAPGAKTDSTTRIFTGAKEVHVIDNYEKSQGIYKFELLIDWGWFYFITKPLFFALDFFYNEFGNFGISIIIVTVIIKLIFFPLANKSYLSMSKMKLLQPTMLKIKEQYKDDHGKQQKALMELYKKEKVNPAAGCLPVLIQVPVFFALYKVLFISIEMRHSPFFGWIQDLAAPDPTSLFNLFGLIPWDPSVLPVIGSFMKIGVWPIVMGLTMFVQMQLNPPPADRTQAILFNWMPVPLTIMLSSFPAGLVIYWSWNNALSIIQQAIIMKRQGVKIELWDNIRNKFQK